VPQRGARAEPLVRGPGAKAPEAESFFVSQVADFYADLDVICK